MVPDTATPKIPRLMGLQSRNYSLAVSPEHWDFFWVLSSHRRDEGNPCVNGKR